MDIEVLAALVGRKLESEADVKAAILELKAKADGSEENAQRVAELEAERLDREATEAVSTAISEGRLAGTDKAKEWATALFKSDRDAWTSYLAATEKGTFSKETKVPPQDRLTDDTKTGDGSIDFPDSVRFFGKEIQVNEEQLETLKKAIRLSRETFNGDLAKAIRAVRR